MAVHVALDARALVVGRAARCARKASSVAPTFVGLLGDQQGAPVQLVAGDHDAEAVEHAPARRARSAGR